MLFMRLRTHSSKTPPTTNLEMFTSLSSSPDFSFTLGPYNNLLTFFTSILRYHLLFHHTQKKYKIQNKQALYIRILFHISICVCACLCVCVCNGLTSFEEWDTAATTVLSRTSLNSCGTYKLKSQNTTELSYSPQDLHPEYIPFVLPLLTGIEISHLKSFSDEAYKVMPYLP